MYSLLKDWDAVNEYLQKPSFTSIYLRDVFLAKGLRLPL